MAIVKPFKAIRATRDKVALVASKSYDLHSNNELEAKLKFNPFSFLHIINAGFQQENISDVDRFKLVHKEYINFKEKSVFIKENKPSFYVYQKKTKNNTFCGIIATTSVQDYHNNVIKKHEGTLLKRELLFEKYLKNTGFKRKELNMNFLPPITIYIYFGL